MALSRPRRARRALSRSTLVAGLAFAAVSLAGACLTLDDISQNVCGNRVLDPGEDCDTTKETSENGYKGTCTAAGSANECKFPVACDLRADGCEPQCAPEATGCVAQCPTGFRAGLDGICHRPSGEFTEPPVAVAITGIEPRVIDLDGDGEKDLMIDGQDREHLAFVQGGIVRSVSEIRKALDARVSVGKLNRDRITPDIVVPTGTSTHDSFALFRGTVGGPPEAYTFPAYEVGAPFRVVPVSSLIFGDPKHGDTFSAGLLMDCTSGAGQLCGFAGLDGRRVMLIDPAVAEGNTWRRTASLPVDEVFGGARLLAVPFRNADDACTDTLIVSEGGALNDLRIIKPCATTAAPTDIATQSIATPGFPPRVPRSRAHDRLVDERKPRRRLRVAPLRSRSAVRGPLLSCAEHADAPIRMPVRRRVRRVERRELVPGRLGPPHPRGRGLQRRR